jgi:hypothetical protein
MIQQKDLDTIRKVCDELKALGYTKPRVTMLGTTDEKSEINLNFSKLPSQTQKEEF